MTIVKTTRLKIRSARSSDIPAILRLESAHGESIWTREELLRVLTREQEIVTLVATRGQVVVGLLMYEVHQKKYDVVTFVCEDASLISIGKPLIEQMIENMSIMLKGKIIIAVRETDLKMQLFLRDMKFRCVKIVKNWYRDYIASKGVQFENAYRFKYEKKIQ